MHKSAYFRVGLTDWTTAFVQWNGCAPSAECADADQPGDDAAEEWANALRFGTSAKRLRPEGGEGGKDWNAMLMTHGPDGLRAFLDRSLRRGESP